jgi:hypothetical protein
VISLRLAKKFRLVFGCGQRPRQDFQTPFLTNQQSIRRPTNGQLREFSAKGNSMASAASVLGARGGGRLMAQTV